MKVLVHKTITKSVSVPYQGLFYKLCKKHRRDHLDEVFGVSVPYQGLFYKYILAEREEDKKRMFPSLIRDYFINLISNYIQIEKNIYDSFRPLSGTIL